MIAARRPASLALPAILGAVLAGCGPGSGAPPPDAGEGEGEGEGEELPGVAVAFEVGGAALPGPLLQLPAHDGAAGPLDTEITLRNVGDAPFAILSEPPILISGADAAQFSITVQPAVTSFAPGDAAPFVLSYAPAAPGSHATKLLFAYGVQVEERVTLDVVASASTGEPGTGVTYIIVDESFDFLPDFDEHTPDESGVVATFDIGARSPTSDVGDFYAFRFDGEIELPGAGDWTFRTTSDDGSRLLIDGAELVDNDGLHAAITQQGTASLAAGRHAIRVEFFEKNGGARLLVEWEGPGVARAPIPASALFH